MMIKILIFSMIFIVSGCASLSETSSTGSYISTKAIDLPASLLLPGGDAIAYQPIARHGKKTRQVRLSLKPLLKKSDDLPADFQVYALSNGRYSEIGHRRQGDALFTKSIAEATYIVSRRFTGQMLVSLNSMCKLVLQFPKPEKTLLPRICTQIFCANDVFTEQSLYENLGLPYDGNDRAPIRLGGWDPVPRDLCTRCTATSGTDYDKPTLKFVCPPKAATDCDSGQVLFNDDFEMDTVGSAPSSSPSGLPTGDSLNASGNVTVINSGSKVVRLTRSSPFGILNAVLDDGATANGSYCIKFTGQAIGDMREPISVTFESENGSLAWLLLIDHNSATLTSGGVSFTLLRDFTQARDFRFDLNLDTRSFNMLVDEEVVVENMPLLDSMFDVPSNMRFLIGQCILECISSIYTVDDIKITKTN